MLFVKTIPNHTLDKNRVPEPKDYIVWQPSKELLAWVKSRQTARRGTRRSTRQPVTDPFMQEAMRVFPGLAPGRPARPERRRRRRSRSQDAAAGIKAIYSELLDRAWADAQARGDKLPPAVAEGIPPTVPGQQ